MDSFNWLMSGYCTHIRENKNLDFLYDYTSRSWSFVNFFLIHWNMNYRPGYFAFLNERSQPRGYVIVKYCKSLQRYDRYLTISLNNELRETCRKKWKNNTNLCAFNQRRKNLISQLIISRTKEQLIISE